MGLRAEGGAKLGRLVGVGHLKLAGDVSLLLRVTAHRSASVPAPFRSLSTAT